VTDSRTIDLHTHSSCSDGSLTPAELVARAASAGVEVLALTDHDTVAGVDAARAAALGTGMQLIPGVEISAAWRAQSIHVLGLWIDPAEAGLVAALRTQAMRRDLRMRKICARLGDLGLPGDQLLAEVEAQPGLPTRAHLAAALVASGIVRRTDDAFRKYLGRGKAAHIAADWPDLGVVIGWIRAAGGIATLAHPARYALSAGARRQLLADFAAAGGDAIEVITGGNAPQHVEACAQWAIKYGFTASLGSDFHRPEHPWNPLGRLAKLPPGLTPVWRSHGL
jgi:predicted metal-dependent phosphoesterase TrpH